MRHQQQQQHQQHQQPQYQQQQQQQWHHHQQATPPNTAPLPKRNRYSGKSKFGISHYSKSLPQSLNNPYFRPLFTPARSAQRPPRCSCSTRQQTPGPSPGPGGGQGGSGAVLLPQDREEVEVHSIIWNPYPHNLAALKTKEEISSNVVVLTVIRSQPCWSNGLARWWPSGGGTEQRGEHSPEGQVGL